jgi:acetyl esterase/lipase
MMKARSASWPALFCLSIIFLVGLSACGQATVAAPDAIRQATSDPATETIAPSPAPSHTPAPLATSTPASTSPIPTATPQPTRAVVPTNAPTATPKPMGPFVEHVITTDSQTASGLYVQDLDGDGDNDILAGSLFGDVFAWWRNDGGEPVVWTQQTIADDAGGALYVYAADIDGDGDNDLLRTFAENIDWWRNEGGDPIVWTRQVVATGLGEAHAIAAADLDGDGDVDILGTAAKEDSVLWWENDGPNGDGTAWVAHTIDDAFRYTQTADAADIDGDGDLDVVAGSGQKDQVAWWRNDGGDPIVWDKENIQTGFDWAHWVHVADLDGDGRPDVLGAAYSDHTVAWWRNSGGDPIAWERQDIDTNFLGVLTVHAADLDGDGDLDVLGAADTGCEIAWWRNDGGTPIHWEKQTLREKPFGGAWGLHAGDLDGDGDIDVVGGGVTEIVWWEYAPLPTPAPEAFNLVADIAYVPEGDPKQKLDLYLPMGATEPVPVLFAIHEGHGSKADFSSWGREQAKNGYAVVAINYRELPEYTYPAPEQDAFCALAWVHANAASYGLDRERVIVVGYSIGGTLGALLGTVDDRARFMEGCPDALPDGQWVQGVIVYTGIFDYTDSSHPAPLKDYFVDYFGAKMESAPDAWAAGSPITWVDGSEPPFLLVHGGGETTIVPGQSKRFAAALEAAGVEVELLIIPGATHMTVSAFPEAIDAVDAFLAARWPGRP